MTEPLIRRSGLPGPCERHPRGWLTAKGECYVCWCEAEVARLKQGLWDCARESGADTDGDETPRHLAHPDIVDYALQEVRQLREDYDEALKESSWIKPQRRIVCDDCGGYTVGSIDDLPPDCGGCDSTNVREVTNA